MTHRDRAAFIASAPFPRNDEDQPVPGRMGRQDKGDKRGLRLGERQAMQVDPSLGIELAPGHLPMRFLVHAEWRIPEPLGHPRHKIMVGLVIDRFSDAETLDRRSRCRSGRNRVDIGRVRHRCWPVLQRLGSRGDPVPEGAFLPAEMTGPLHPICSDDKA